MPLEPEDQTHLQAAQGYIELKMFLDANEELEEITAECRHLPEVLGVRLMIYEALQKWELAEVVAKRLVKYDPDDVEWILAWANATRRAGSVEAAKAILLDAVERNDEEPQFYYQLGCLECQLQDLQASMKHLEKAFKLDPKLRLRALDDEDLMRLWLVIEGD